jgi:Bacterial extracellular solute-binding proteins, family 5 Middle
VAVRRIRRFRRGQGPAPTERRLRAAGHVVHGPDLYDGKTFTDLDEGVGYAPEVGFGAIGERGRLAADGLPNELVYAGFSLGALPAQELAQTRPGAKGAPVAFRCSERGAECPRDSDRGSGLRDPRRAGQAATGARVHVRRQRHTLLRSPDGRDDSIVLNTSRPLFRVASVRRAVAYAVDREALLHATGFLPGKVTDQILPPAIPGYRRVEIYPRKADVQTAGKLMGNCRGTAVLYISDNPVDASVAAVLIQDLARIDVTVKLFRTAEYNRRIHRRAEPFDMALSGWVAD